MRARLTIAVLAATLCMEAWAAATDQHQYMARKKYLFAQPNASAPAPILDVVAQVGGHVDFDLRDWLVITIPASASETIRQHPAVKYLLRVINGPSDAMAVAAQTRAVAATAQRPVLRPTPTSVQWSSGTYKYDGAGNISAIGSDSFTYDPLSRLVNAKVSGKTETYTYDSFGNLISKTTTDPTKTPPDLIVSLSTNTSTNHLTLQGYDAAGNLTGDSSETNVFDPVSMHREKDIPGSSLSEQYVYNAADERLGVVECPGPPPFCPEAPVFWSFRDETGKVLRQYQSWYTFSVAKTWAWIEDYVYRDGLLLGAQRVPEEGGRRHFHLDHLGTPRLMTNDSGAQVAAHDYYPFGVEFTSLQQEVPAGYDREEPMKFTGHLRDFNVGTASDNANYNDFMHARNTIPQWGRFLSVDPNINMEIALHQPQRWNRYSYAANNPVKYVDPNGRDVTLFIRDNSGGGGWTNFGHTAVRVFGKGYDYTFDFGRYRDTHMLVFGEGILRTWSNWEAFLKKQSGHGSTRTVTWQTPGAYDAAVIKYFQDLAAKGQQTNQTADYTEYKLARDYSVFGANCSTLSCEAMSAAESQTGFSLQGFDRYFSGATSPSEAWSAANEYNQVYGPDALERMQAMDFLFNLLYGATTSPKK